MRQQILNCPINKQNLVFILWGAFAGRKKELIDDNGDLKPHVEKIIENVFYYGKQCINAILPTCFIEIEYKTSDGNYLINHSSSIMLLENGKYLARISHHASYEEILKL